MVEHFAKSAIDMILVLVFIKTKNMMSSKVANHSATNPNVFFVVEYHCLFTVKMETMVSKLDVT